MSQSNTRSTHTAHFLVSKFLNSRESLEFDLSSNDKHILRYLSDLMDMTAYSSSIRQCKIPLEQAALFTSMGSRTIQRSISTLLKLELLSDISRGHGLKGIYILGAYFETCASQVHHESVDNSETCASQAHHEPVDNSEMRHTGALDAPHRRKDAPVWRTSNKALKNSYKKEQGGAAGSSLPSAVDNYLNKQSFQFTPEEMEESYRRDIHIQPCFNKFWIYVESKGRDKFKRSDWEAWFARESNGKSAKNATIHHLGEHFDNQMREHEIIKRAPMPESLRALIKKMKMTT